jgi:two-component system chemotaxis sensor kinase CheA
VARLEEFAAASIERSASRPVVQYRGEILPIVALADYFGHARETDRAVHQAIVYSAGGRQVGLLVDRILDIVDVPLQVAPGTGRRGIAGSAIVNQKVTDLLDVQAVIEDAQAHGFGTQAA